MITGYRPLFIEKISNKEDTENKNGYLNVILWVVWDFVLEI